MSPKKSPYARPDARTREAKAQGFPARSVFKLREIDERVRLFSKGMRVLDLGAAPGSWALYASQRVGASGRVFAVDIRQIEQKFADNVTVLELDALTADGAALAAFAPYDVILSDMAPSTSGSKVRDQAQSFELFMCALELGSELGKPGSSFVGKLFMSSDFSEAQRALRVRFETSKVIRPEGTRRQSSEVFCVGMGLRNAGKY